MPAIFVTEGTEVFFKTEEEENEIDPLLLTIAREPELEVCYRNVHEEPKFVSIEKIKSVNPPSNDGNRTSNFEHTDVQIKAEPDLLIKTEEEEFRNYPSEFIVETENHEETRIEPQESLRNGETNQNDENSRSNEINSFDYPSKIFIKQELEYSPNQESENDKIPSSNHQITDQYTCKVTNIPLNQKTDLSVNKKQKNLNLRHCSECNRAFRYPSMLQYHLKYFCGSEVRFECPYCDYKTKTRKCVLRHVQVNHPTKLVRAIDLTKTEEESSKKSWKFYCDRCGQGFPSKESLVKHLKYTCGIEEKYGCPYCKYRSKRYHWSVRHVRSVHKKETLNILKFERI